MNDLILHNVPISGNAYKIRLLLSMLGLKYKCIDINLAAGESLTEDFLQLNPRGQVPVLEDGDVVIWDSMAILVYLARQYGGADWLPADAIGEAQVMQWLALSENELLYGLARSRAIKIFDKPFNLEQCQAEGIAGLEVLNQHLSRQKWLATAKPTIADLACYPYVKLAPVGDISLEPFAHVRQWLARIEGLPGWVPQLG